MVVSSVGGERMGYHLVDISPWPVVTSMNVFSMVTGGISFMHGGATSGVVLIAGVMMFFVSVMKWTGDVVREGSYEGQHTKRVTKGLRIGMVMFIVSEVMFFFSFFWSYFWSVLGAEKAIGGVWPPRGLSGEVLVSAWELPLMNTMILLTSGATMTWGHHALTRGQRRDSSIGIGITILLGGIFTGLQGIEYMEGAMRLNDGIYGSTFYMTTGFHGMHVMLGTTMLIVGLKRVIKYEVTREHNLGIEAGAMYWHFVDVVWLGLFIGVYWWGGI